MLEVKNLSVKIETTLIVDDVSFVLKPGQWLMIAGPNGAGKSTIVNAIAQGIPYTGKVLFNGNDISRMKPVIRAHKLGVLSQQHNVSYSFSVDEVVRLGRYSHSPNMLSGSTDEDDNMVQRALELTGMIPLRYHSVLTLSGGELQRAFLAQLIAQDPGILILDEPTNHLDLVYQKQVFTLIGEWIAHTGRSVISVVHDLSLAKAYGSHALLLNKGKLIASGEINTVLTRENLNNVYNIDVYNWMQEMLSQWQ